MDLAKSQAVADEWFAARIPVSQNVSGVQELDVPKSANGALLPVSTKDQAPKVLLVKAMHYRTSDVFTACDTHGVDGVDFRSWLIRDHHELQSIRLISHDIYRQDCVIDSRVYSDQVDQGLSLLHRDSKGDIVRVMGIVPSVLVDKVAGFSVMYVGIRGVS